MKPLTELQLQIEKTVLEYIYRAGYQPVKPRVIAKKLDIPKEQKDDFKRTVKFLIREGKLVYGANHLIRPVAEESEKLATESLEDTPSTEPESKPKKPSKTAKTKKAAQVNLEKDRVGIFRRNQRGFGFVRPRGSEGKDREEVDIYIPANRAGNASSGDLVRFELIRSSEHFQGRRRRQDTDGPRLKGTIVEVLQRRTTQFVGTFRQGKTIGRVTVDRNRFAEPIVIREEDFNGATSGDKVVVEVTHFPSAFNDGAGIVKEILGRADDPEVDFQTILSEFNLPDAFDAAALDEVQKVADAFDASNLAGRVDLTAKTIVTIDPINARDFDDAVSLERIDDDWLLGVHIADVAHFVREKSALDLAARDRATSVYLPDRVIPMLPETISNHLASLQPNENRYAKSVFIRFSANGTFLGAEFSRSVIRSDRRLTYEEVDEFLEAPKTFEKRWGTAVCDLLGRMHELAVLLRARRFARGSLELMMPDVRINLGESGEVIGAETVESTESRRIIEEFMLAANEAVAQELTDREIRFLRRTHGKPSPRKMEQLSEFVRELGFDIDSLEDRFALQRLLISTADVPEGRAVHYAVLRSMQRAVYSGKAMPEGHYALATENYCHFTSPIRRYPDLTVHRVLDRIFDGKTPSVEPETLIMLAEHCSDREQRAEAAERAATELKLIRYLETRPGESFHAVITGVERLGLFVQGIDLPVEGLVPVDLLPHDRYYHDRAAHILSGHRASNRFRLGDPIHVELVRVNIERREILFQPIFNEQDSEPLRRKKRTRSGGKPPHKHKKRHKR